MVSPALHMPSENKITNMWKCATKLPSNVIPITRKRKTTLDAEAERAKKLEFYLVFTVVATSTAAIIAAFTR